MHSYTQIDIQMRKGAQYRESKLKKFIFAVTAAVSVGSVASATAVSPGGFDAVGSLTNLGTFEAGSYRITAAGVVDLAVGTSYNLFVDADGTPTTEAQGDYSYFNSSGSAVDIFQPGVFGAAGSTVKLGALIGTFSTNPYAPDDWFLIGTSKTITLLSTQTLWASVNDTYHQNNGGQYLVSIAAVPEPGSYALMLGGLLALGLARPRRDASRLAAAAAT